ncbi:MAG: hypothetical protein II813_05105 [Spirochaetales bacterium]|nr:hypothetical protein [Spirochaetales bacterium]
MRKVLVLLLAILMVFAIVSCKEPEPKKGELPVDKEVGKERLIEQGAVAKAVDHSGFKLVLTADAGEGPVSMELGGKNGVYWAGLVDASVFVREHEGKTYFYAAGSWIKIADKTLKERLFDENLDDLLYAAYDSDVKDALMDAGSETKHGRDCAKYTVSFTDEGVKYSFTIWVDKEYGITMGIEAAAGSAAVTYDLDPKLSGLVEEDLPTGYAAAYACDVYSDEI